MRCTDVGTREDRTLPRASKNGSRESPASDLAWPRGWTVPPRFSKAWEDEDGKLFFSLAMKKSNTHRAPCTFFPRALSLRTGEGEVDAEDSKCAPKHMPASRQNLNIQRHFRKGALFLQSRLSGPYAPKALKKSLVIRCCKMIPELTDPKTPVQSLPLNYWVWDQRLNHHLSNGKSSSPGGRNPLQGGNNHCIWYFKVFIHSISEILQILPYLTLCNDQFQQEFHELGISPPPADSLEIPERRRAATHPSSRSDPHPPPTKALNHGQYPLWGPDGETPRTGVWGGKGAEREWVKESASRPEKGRDGLLASNNHKPVEVHRTQIRFPSRASHKAHSHAVRGLGCSAPWFSKYILQRCYLS